MFSRRAAPFIGAAAAPTGRPAIPAAAGVDAAQAGGSPDAQRRVCGDGEVRGDASRVPRRFAADAPDRLQVADLILPGSRRGRIRVPGDRRRRVQPTSSGVCRWPIACASSRFSSGMKTRESGAACPPPRFRATTSDTFSDPFVNTKADYFLPTHRDGSVSAPGSQSALVDTCILRKGGIHHAEIKTVMGAAVPAPDGRAGSSRTYTAGLGAGVRTVGAGDLRRRRSAIGSCRPSVTRVVEPTDRVRGARGAASSDADGQGRNGSCGRR